MGLMEILFGEKEKMSVSAKNLLGGSYKEGEHKAEGMLKVGGNMELTQFGAAVVNRSARTMIVTASARITPEPLSAGGQSGSITNALPCLKVLIDRSGAVEIIGLGGFQFEKVSGSFASGSVIINNLQCGDKISVLCCSYGGDAHFDLMYFGVAEL